MIYSINKSNHLIGTLLLNREDIKTETSCFNRLQLDIADGLVRFNFELITDNLDNYQSYWGEMPLNELPNYWAKQLIDITDVRFFITSLINNNKFLGYVIEN